MSSFGLKEKKYGAVSYLLSCTNNLQLNHCSTLFNQMYTNMDNPLGNNYNTNWSKWWYANKRVPGSEFLGKRSSGPSVQELQELEKRVPGSEFLGKELIIYHLAIRKSLLTSPSNVLPYYLK